MRLILIAIVCLCLTCCGRREQSAAAPGYHGPTPSGEVQRELKALAGVVFDDIARKFGGGEWRVECGFAVTPYRVAGESGESESRKGPHARLERPDGGSAESLAVPLETDEEARAFIAAVEAGVGDGRGSGG